MTEQTPAETPSNEASTPVEQTPAEKGRWVRRIPLGLALTAVASVWLVGCVWSFEEQTAYAEFKHFHLPWLLPLVIDGMAIAMGAVAFAAALDARPAVFARVGTAVSVALSAASNGAWAWERSTADPGTIALAAVVPVVANLAFEVLLSEMRRQVMRRRGVPAPVPIPLPRVTRMILSPWSTFWSWRRLVLKATDLDPLFAAAESASRMGPDPVRQTPHPSRSRTPSARRTRSGAAKQTPRGRTPRNQTPPNASDPPQGVRSPRDAEDLTRLRSEFPDRTPSINEVQRLIECGRARAVRLRDLTASTPVSTQVNGHNPLIGTLS